MYSPFKYCAEKKGRKKVNYGKIKMKLDEEALKKGISKNQIAPAAFAAEPIQPGAAGAIGRVHSDAAVLRAGL